MRTVVSFFTLFFVLSTFCLSLDKSIVATAHKTAHLFTFHMPGNERHCSATAIGPHTLLTASHCSAKGVLTIDGKFVTIKEIMLDGQDHSIYILGDIEFKDWAVFSTDSPTQGDEVFIFGNPYALRDIYRKGTLAGFVSPSEGSIYMLFDLNGFFGDSGAAIFNEKGQIMGVINCVEQENQHETSFKLMGALPIRFSDLQLAKIR